MIDFKHSDNLKRHKLEEAHPEEFKTVVQSFLPVLDTIKELQEKRKADNGSAQ